MALDWIIYSWDLGGLMAFYTVQMPIAGTVSRSIEADSPEEALEKFYEIDFDSEKDDWEWDYYERMTTGNVNHFHFNKVIVTKESE